MTLRQSHSLNARSPSCISEKIEFQGFRELNPLAAVIFDSQAILQSEQTPYHCSTFERYEDLIDREAPRGRIICTNETLHDNVPSIISKKNDSSAQCNCDVVIHIHDSNARPRTGHDNTHR